MAAANRSEKISEIAKQLLDKAIAAVETKDANVYDPAFGAILSFLNKEKKDGDIQITNPFTNKISFIKSITSNFADLKRKAIERTNVKTPSKTTKQERKKLNTPAEQQDMKKGSAPTTAVPITKLGEDSKEELHGVSATAPEVKKELSFTPAPKKGLTSAVKGGKVVEEKKEEKKEVKIQDQIDEIKKIQKMGLSAYIRDQESKGLPLDPAVLDVVKKNIIEKRFKEEEENFDYLSGEKNIIEYMAGTKFSSLFSVPKLTNPSQIVDPQLEPTGNKLFQLDKEAKYQRFENSIGTNQNVKPYLLPFKQYVDLGEVINTIGFRNTKQLQKTMPQIQGFVPVDPVEPIISGITSRQYISAMTR